MRSESGRTRRSKGERRRVEVAWAMEVVVVVVVTR